MVRKGKCYTRAKCRSVTLAPCRVACVGEEAKNHKMLHRWAAKIIQFRRFPRTNFRSAEPCDRHSPVSESMMQGLMRFQIQFPRESHGSTNNPRAPPAFGLLVLSNKEQRPNSGSVRPDFFFPTISDCPPPSHLTITNNQTSENRSTKQNVHLERKQGLLRPLRLWLPHPRRAQGQDGIHSRP